MSGEMTPLELPRLLRWILREERRGSVFGIPRELLFVPRPDDVFRMERYGQTLETPLGVAAGPHTQLAQNIVAAWLTGARYIELKTVQTLENIEVAHPCIDMEDEGYNCEWSQELTLDQSFGEYLNAWILLHILKDHLGWGDPKEPGFIFNMSVGYDLAGILKPNVQLFLDRMADAGAEIAMRTAALADDYPEIAKIPIPARVSDNLTLSTMHGCPPDEIEKIAVYMLEERRLHTTVKLNPTLLGPERLRAILNDRLGYKVVVPDDAFAHDLQYDKAVGLINHLRETAQRAGVNFGIKLTNTLEVLNPDRGLPNGGEKVYLSGRALHPISVALAAKLQREFDGALAISFSAGADCWNVARLLAGGLRPVTVCSDLLRPGGYTRLPQYLENIEKAVREVGASDLRGFVLKRAETDTDYNLAALRNLEEYSCNVLENREYHRDRYSDRSIKTTRELGEFDCIHPPCVAACAIQQDIPSYLERTAAGDFAAAYRVISEDNPFPNVTGLVCDHLCQTKCMRINYDDPLRIREVKRFLAGRFEEPETPDLFSPNGLRVAIIGAGPSGLACARFLALDGFSVEIFEAKQQAGGMVSGAIPGFRLDDVRVRKDIDAILSLGVLFHRNQTVDRERFQQIRKEFDFVYIAVGARKSRKLEIPGEDSRGVIDQINFLSRVRQGERVDLGPRVVVIGGGNSAVDAARTALRLVDETGRVTVLYRRSRREMPADRDEVREMLEEGVELSEKTVPLRIHKTGKAITLECQKVSLGEPDSSGRPRPVPMPGSDFELEADTVITAIGQEVDLDFLPEGTLDTNQETGETQFRNVFAGGDAIRGASTLIKAVGDGKRTARFISLRAGIREEEPETPRETRQPGATTYQVRQARRVFTEQPLEPAAKRHPDFSLIQTSMSEAEARREAARCLLCDDYCSVCESVCPNRANRTYTVRPMEYKTYRAVLENGKPRLETVKTVKIEQKFQVLNIADFCNECGNCTTFCPTSGEPFRVKPRFFLHRGAFENAAVGYYLHDNVLEARAGGVRMTLARLQNSLEFNDETILARLNPQTFDVEELRFLTEDTQSYDLAVAPKMALMLTALEGWFPAEVSPEKQV